MPTYVLQDYIEQRQPGETPCVCCPPEWGGHRTYRRVLHHADARGLETNQPGPGKIDVLDEAIQAAGAKHGDEIEVIILKTGRRPFGNSRPVHYRGAPASVYTREGSTQAESEPPSKPWIADVQIASPGGKYAARRRVEIPADHFQASLADTLSAAETAIHRVNGLLPHDGSVTLSASDVRFLRKALGRCASENVWVSVRPASGTQSYCALEQGVNPHGQTPATEMKAILALLSKLEGK